MRGHLPDFGSARMSHSPVWFPCVRVWVNSCIVRACVSVQVSPLPAAFELYGPVWFSCVRCVCVCVCVCVFDVRVHVRMRVTHVPAHNVSLDARLCVFVLVRSRHIL